jgi:ribosome-associated protein
LKKPAPKKPNSATKSRSSTRKTNPVKKAGTAKSPSAGKATGRKPSVKGKAGTAQSKKAGSKKATSARKAPASRRKTKAPSPSRAALQMITAILDTDQAEDVTVIDLAGKSAMADYMVIASGRNPRHIGAMAEHLRERIKASSGRTPPIEGLATADWVLVDQGDVVVHLFRPEVRRLYNLEKMWGAVLGPEREDAEPRQSG